MHSLQTAQNCTGTVARYSSPTTAALGRLLLPYLFPELSAFATVEDLVTHLRNSDARYRAALPAEFLDRNPPPMYITLYFIVTRLPDSLLAVRDHFLALDPTALTVDLLEQHLLAAETSVVAVGAAPGTPRTPFFEGCSPSPLDPSYASTATADVLSAEDVRAASASMGHLGVVVAARMSFAQRPHWAELLRSGVAIFDLDYDAIFAAMYALSVIAKGECYLCVPPDPGIEAAALGASESDLPGTAPAEALHTFTLDSGASRCFFCNSTTLTPLSAPVLVKLADPSGGPDLARSSTVLPCPAVPSGSLSGLHLPSFSTNLVSTAALKDAMVTTTTPGGQRVSICTSKWTGRHLATFTRRPGSSLYTLATEPPQVAAFAQNLVVLGGYGHTNALLNKPLYPNGLVVGILTIPLPSPPGPSLPAVPDPESDLARATTPTVSRLLATVDTGPSFESTAVSAFVAELLDFAATCRQDYATALFTESDSASPPSVGGKCALGTDVLEDKQEDFECLAAAVPRFASLLRAPEEDPDALDIPTQRSYAEAITCPYSSQWQTAMDAEMTFSPTPKMSTLWVFLHVAAQRDYELHSLDFSRNFLQGSPHEEIWLRCPPGFTGSFPTGTQWSLWRPVYGLRQAPREWHDTLRTTLVALGFTPSAADPSLFLRTDTPLPPFYVLVYVDDLIFTTADTEALTLVKSEL
ncbi:unnamed protein product [Closterium sp. NIES-54]